MNELSLFSGAGGGLLGTKLLGWQAVGYVEFNDYCQRVLAQRIDDGMLERAPIFGDINAFIDQGYAASYSGLVDVITAGFPCQPFSVAGKQDGENDARNKWPQTIECIRIIRPQFALLENVPGLFAPNKLTLLLLEKVVQRDLFDENHRSKIGQFIRRSIIRVTGLSYFGRVLGDLAEAGFDARWCVLGADDCGAPHRRKRVWILCTNNQGERCRQRWQGRSAAMCAGECEQDESIHASIPETNNRRRRGRTLGSRKRAQSENRSQSIPNTRHERLEERSWMEPSGSETTRPHTTTEACQRWPAEPPLGRVANGVADRVDQLKALGNGQVPRVVAAAWELLSK